jgi:hypothetical protein
MDFGYRIFYYKIFLNVKGTAKNIFKSSFEMVTLPIQDVNIKTSIAKSEAYHRLNAISNFYVQMFG